MNRCVSTILAQRDSGLITAREARISLRHLSKQAQFNADYSDSLDSYNRWTGEARAAAQALAS